MTQSGFDLLPPTVVGFAPGQRPEDDEDKDLPRVEEPLDSIPKDSAFSLLPPEIAATAKDPVKEVEDGGEPSLLRKASLFATHLVSDVVGLPGNLVAQMEKEMAALRNLADPQMAPDPEMSAFERIEAGLKKEPQLDYLPSSQSTLKNLEQLTGGQFTDLTPEEQAFLNKYERPVAGALVGGVVGGAPGAAIGALGGVASAFAGELMRDFGFDERIQRAAEGAGGMIVAPLAMPKVTKGAGNVSKDLPIKQKAVNKALRVKPAQVNRDIIEAGKKLNLKIPASAAVDNELVQMAEAKLAASGLSGKALEKSKIKFIEDMAKRVNDSVEQISKESFANRVNAGQEVQSALEQARNISRNQYKAKYDQADAGIIPGDKMPSKGIAEIEAKITKNLTKTATPTADQEAILGKMRQLRAELYEDVPQILGPDGRRLGAAKRLKPLDVETLSATRRSIGDTIKWEIQGKPDKMLVELYNEMGETLKQYGKINPAFGVPQAEADALFAEHAKIFRNDNVNKAIFAENPEQITHQFTKPGSLEQLQKALEPLGEAGQTMAKRYQRFELERSFLGQVVDQNTGAIKMGALGNKVKGDLLDKLEAFAGPEAAETIKQLSKVSRQVDLSSKRFFNASQTASSIMDMTGLGYIAKNAWQAIRYQDPSALVRAGMGIKAPRVMANLLADEQFITAMETISDPRWMEPTNLAKQAAKQAKGIIPEGTPVSISGNHPKVDAAYTIIFSKIAQEIGRSQDPDYMSQ